MKGILVVALLALLLPGAARSAACSPLNCAPSQFTLAGGTLLGVRAAADRPLRVIDLRNGTTRWRLPAGIVTGHALVHQDGALLTWFDVASGRRLTDATLQRGGAFRLVGTSQDASRAVLARTQSRSTTFAIVSRTTQRSVRLAGNRWSFDALRGSNLFLIETLRSGYRVRLYDLETGVLRAQPLKDANEPATIAGIPFARASTGDGRYLFTLYVESDGGAMIHELDLAAVEAHCIDLPGSGDFNASITWSLVLDPDGRTVWAVSPGYGRVVAVDVAAHTPREAYSFERANWTANAGAAVMSPDGERIAVTDAQHIWYVDLARRKVVHAANHVAVALGFSPDQRRLWVVGQRSRVSPLPVRWTD